MKKIKHLNFREDFNNEKYEYVLGTGIRLDLVGIIMKINEIINKLNEEPVEEVNSDE